MKYSKYFGAMRRRFIKSESNLVPRGARHFKSENIRCDISPFVRVFFAFAVITVHGEISECKSKSCTSVLKCISKALKMYQTQDEMNVQK
jgi:hypothetical protein